MSSHTVSRAKFFCENCKHEVKPNSKVCPHCGRFFTAVKCPACGFTGENKLFTLGCPNCGYSGSSGVTSIPSSAGSSAPAEGESYDAGEIEGRKRPTYKPTERRDTPAWVFPLAILMLVGAFAVLVVVYLNL
jgi:hypothetical protein